MCPVLQWFRGLPRLCGYPTAYQCCTVMVHAGLDVEKDTIIEIACIITDGNMMRQIEVT